MKKRLSLIAVFVIVVAQLGWLGYNYHARRVELAAAPTLLVECDAFDPRDFFRGDYVSFDCKFTYPMEDPLFLDLFHWNECMPIRLSPDEVAEGITVQPLSARAATNPDSIEIATDGWQSRIDEKLVGYWVAGADGKAKLTRVVKLGSSGDVPHPGEMRTHLRARWKYDVEEDAKVRRVRGEVELVLVPHEQADAWFRYRFYVPENTGEPHRAWRSLDANHVSLPLNRIRSTVEFACRERDGLVAKQLYINDIPWVQAVRMMEQGTFPLLPEQPTAAEQN